MNWSGYLLDAKRLNNFLSFMWGASCIVLMCIIVIGFARSSSSSVYANHRESVLWWHQANIHSSSKSEAICVISASSHVSNDSFRSNVRSKLYIDNPNQDWQGFSGNRINFDFPLVNGAVQPCNQFPNRASIPIETYLAHNVAGSDPSDNAIVKSYWGRLSTCGNISCTSNENIQYNPAAGHDDTIWSYVWFQEKALYYSDHSYNSDAQRAFIVSHEFGHVLGLADGGWSGDTLCEASVMHDGKGVCGPGASVVWPQDIDRATAIATAYNNINPVGAGTYDNTSSSVVYNGSWTSGTNFPRAHNGTVIWSNTGAATAQLTFTGSRITRRYTMAFNRGSERVYIDGIDRGGSSSYAPTTRWQVDKTWEVPYGTHTIEVRADGGGYSDLDAFIVDTPVVGSGSYENNNSQIRYMGTWNQSSSFPSASAGTLSWSNTTENATSFTFVGSQVTYVFTKVYNRGYAAITIDGIDKGVTDLYAPSTLWQSSVTYGGLGYGVHTIHVSVTGQKSGAASDRYIDLDRFIVQ